ncbi:MAG: response regulator, partial [Gammaproteobacteria bacterium]
MTDYSEGPNLSPSTETTILVVEDSPVEAELLRRTLVRDGFRVRIARNGQEALEMVREQRPALVMSDIQMPVIDGYQLCLALKLDDDLWNVPIILLTVLSEPEDIIKAINCGADAYITKPFAEDKLIQRIHSFLDIPLQRRRKDERRNEIIGYDGKQYTITGGGQQILNLLLSLYENSLQKNKELINIQAQLNLLNDSLDQQIRERTESLARTNRTLQTLSACNQAMVRSNSEDELLRIILSSIVENGGYQLAAISLSSDDRNGIVTPVVYPEIEDGDFMQKAFDSVNIDNSESPVVKAYETGTTEIVRNTMSENSYLPWKAFMKTNGFVASIALPLVHDSEMLGVLTIFSINNCAFDEQEVGLMNELAGDLAYGIVNQRAKVNLKSTEETLRHTETRYRTLFDNSLDAILLTTPSGGILAANPEAQRLFGLSEQILREQGREAVVDPTDPRLAAALEERGRTGKFRGELTLIGKNNVRFPAEVLSQIFKGRDGQLFTSMIVRDISERKASEELVRKLSLAVEQSSANIIITDLDGKIEYVNKSFLSN